MTVFFGCIGPVDEGGNARGRYERGQFEHTLAGTVTFRWNLGTGSGILNTGDGYGYGIYTLAELGLSAYPEARLWIDEAVASDWIVGPPHYFFTVNMDLLPPGHHVMRVEGRGGGQSYFCSNVLFHTGLPIPTDQPQWIWSAPTKFDQSYVTLSSDRAVRVWYPGFVPKPRTSPMPARVAEPYTTLLPPSQQWVTRLGVFTSAGLVRRFTTRSGRVGCANYQQYHYFDQRTDRVPLVDGDRGTAVGGHVVAARVAPNGSFYWLAANGRIGWTGTTGKTLTILGRHLRSGPDGTALNPTPALQPYTYNPADRMAAIEWFCDWKTPGMQQDFSEPWDLAFYPDAPASPGHPLVLFTDTQPMTGGTPSLTGIGRVCMMDHTPAHAGGVSAVWELWTHPVTDAQPWGIDRGPDGRYYVTCCMTHDIWALEIAVDGMEPNVSPRLVSAERVFQSALRPTLADLGLRERFEQRSPIAAQTLRDRYNRDGGPGVGSLIFPQSLRFLSDGTALVFCRYTFTIHRIDFSARTVTLFASHPAVGSADLRDWVADVNVDGTTGPRDLVRATVWGMSTDAMWTADGVYQGRFLPGGRSVADMLVTEGPADYHVGFAYPWGVASGRGKLVLWGTGATQAFALVTKRQPTDPVFNPSLYAVGQKAYRHPPGQTPSFTLSHGDEFQGQLGLPVPDELAGMPDADLGAYWRAGLGTGIPRAFTDAEVAGLIYYTRWGAVAGPPPLPVLDAPQTLHAVLT